MVSKSDQRSTRVMSPSASLSTGFDVDSVDTSEMAVDEQMIKDIGNFLDRLNLQKAASGGEESADSFEVPVDSKTIEEVNTFLYSLNIREPGEIHSVLEQVASSSSTVSDPIGAMRRATSDDFIYGSEEGDDDSSESSSTGSVNPETLAEIGAYIDAVVSKAPSTASEMSTRQHGDAPTFADPVVSVTSWQSETNASKTVTLDETTAVSYADDDEVEAAIVQNYSEESNTIVAQTRVSKPSPIYEQVEAKSMPRGIQGMDPPAVMTFRKTDQVDPPATTINMNDAVMRMHESQAMAPSYSVESLESENMIMDHHKSMEEEEKKAEDDMDQETSKFNDCRSGNTDEVGTSLTPVIEASSSETDISEAKLEVNAGNEATFKRGLPPTPREQAGTNGQDKPSKESSQTAHEELSSAKSETTETSTSSELVDDAGVPLRTQLSADGSDMEVGRASQLVGRYEMLEADGSDDANEAGHPDDKNSHQEDDGEDDEDDESHCSDIVTDLPEIGLRNLPNSPSMKDDDDSLPWDLKDIASEETMKAAGRTRPAALNPASRSKARKLISLLSDDSSVPQSEFSMKENDDSKVDDDTETESDTQKSGFAYDDECVIEDGEDGVEVLESALGAEIEEEIFPTDNIPAAPSPDEDRESPLVDPSGHLGPKIDADEEVAETRPDPDTADSDTGDEVESGEEIGENFVEDSGDETESGEENGDNFVEAFLQGSTSADDVNEHGTADASKDLKSTSQFQWFNPFAFSSKAKSAEEEEEEEGPGFLEQFQALEIDNEDVIDLVTADEGTSVDSEGISSEAALKTPRNLFTLVGIARFFAALDEKFRDDSGFMAQNVRFFQRIVAPVVAGEKPSIIEAAQIRQAALRAEIPLEVVDRFLDLIDERSQQAPDAFPPKDLDQDQEINAFLIRFGVRNRGHPNANGWRAEDYIGVAGGADETIEIDADVTFVTKGGINETIEIDADDTFVTKGGVDQTIEIDADDTFITKIEDDDDDNEWWKGQQKKNSDLEIQITDSYQSGIVDKIIGVDSDFDDDEEDNDKAVGAPEKLAPTSPPHAERVKKLQARKEAHPIINKRYGFGEDDEWTRRNGMAHYGAGWEAHTNWLSPRSNSNLRRPLPIDGVATADNLRRFVFSKKMFKNHQPWRRLYRERTQYHPGFMEVDVHSIYESTGVDLTVREEEDYIPWERREVQQRFLQEKSYSYSRNWFGDLIRKRGNQKIKMPVCKPKSMEMPIENLPDQGEWTKEWFTQWKSPHERRALRASKSRASKSRASKSDEYTTDGSYTDGETSTDHFTATDGGTFTDHGTTFTDHGSVTDHSVTDRGTFTTTDHGYTDHGSDTEGSTSHHIYDESSYSASSGTGSSGSSSWEEAPECGEIINVRQKIGERVTRVHPDFTSSLRRSRWRKKYFPRGTFPY